MAEIHYKDIKADGDQYKNWQISLVKLTGKQIADITGYISQEFGDPVFKVCSIVMDDGTEIDVEGEHDLPYLVTYSSQPQPNMDDATMGRLADEQDEEDA